MNNDKCQLVAWTEGGNVKMSLDLIKEMSQEYLERIKSLESTVYKRHKAGEEVPFILALSFAREEYGNFLNESGLTFLALRQYIEASSVCTSGSDLNWSDCDEGFVLCGPLWSAESQISGDVHQSQEYGRRRSFARLRFRPQRTQG